MLLSFASLLEQQSRQSNGPEPVFDVSTSKQQVGQKVFMCFGLFLLCSIFMRLVHIDVARGVCLHFRCKCWDDAPSKDLADAEEC